MPLGRRRRTQRTPPSVAATATNARDPQSPLSPLVARGEVSVKREVLVTCLTCPLCQGLFRDATTIPECLHTFCRKCISKKLVDEEECCPICKIDLGVSAADKLRSDHHLQYLRDKLFPIKRKRTQSENDIPNPVSTVQIQTQKVKERSLSSLVDTTAQSKASRRFCDLSDESSSPILIGNAKKKSKLTRLKKDESTSPPEGVAMVTYARRQTSPDVDGSNSHSQKREKGNKKGLNLTKPEDSSPATEVITGKITPCNGKLSPEEGKSTGNKFLKVRRNKGSFRKISAQRLLSSKPIWFSLIASSNPEGGAVLPQLTANFLRIKDGEMKVSSIQKYVKNKLGLGAGNEVDIVCRGQTINPDMNVYGLMNMWIRNESSHKIRTTVGTSAKDFVMMLSYHLKFQSQL